MSPCSQRHTPAVRVFHIYMLCTLYQIQVTLKMFSPAFCSAPLRACTKQHLSSYKHSRESKKSFNKISGEFSWLIVCSCFCNHKAWHALCHYCISTMKSRGAGTTRRIHLQAATAKPPELFRQFDCVAPSSNKIKTAYRYIPTNISPLPHLLFLPEDPLCKTITFPNLTLTYTWKCGGVGTELWLVLTWDLQKAVHKHRLWAVDHCGIAG